jgi:hypothetical protein
MTNYKMTDDKFEALVDAMVLARLPSDGNLTA